MKSEKLSLGKLTLEQYVEKNFDKLFEYYLSTGEMPYGVAKARTGDPYNWIADKLEQERM